MKEWEPYGRSTWRADANPRIGVHRALLRCLFVAGVALGTGTGCSLDKLVKSDEVPPNLTDPAITQTRDGAIRVYHGTIVLFQSAFGGPRSSFVATTGVFSDELGYRDRSFGLDGRNASETSSEVLGLFQGLQRVRGQAGEAIGLLGAHASDVPALAGHAYALKGYAELLLAEAFCSGVPLSTLDFDGNFTYKPASTSDAVFQHAILMFDSASTIASDSLRFVLLAAVGKGRALLAMDDYVGAAAAVAAVPDDYRYLAQYTSTVTTGSVNPRNIFDMVPHPPETTAERWDYSVADGEGHNGLDYQTSGDPRSMVVQATWDASVYLPMKYVMDGSSPIVVASGLEARLIEAEAALHAHDYSAWIDKLNYLRQTETFWSQIVPNPGGPLATLVDPGPDAGGTDSLRVNLLFRERALWLFLTGHRQGDLRRLVRQYGRESDDVYPFGPYAAPGVSTLMYGTDVAFPVPSLERTINPLFHGCISHTNQA